MKLLLCTLLVAAAAVLAQSQQQEACTPFKATAHRLNEHTVRVVFEPMQIATVASAHMSYGKATEMADQFTHVKDMHYIRLRDADIFTAIVEEAPEEGDTLVFRIKFDQVLGNGQVQSCISNINTIHLGGERLEEEPELEQEQLQRGDRGGRGHWGGGRGWEGRGWGRGYGAYGYPYGMDYPLPYPVPSGGQPVFPPVVPVSPTNPSGLGCPEGSMTNQLGQCVLLTAAGIPFTAAGTPATPNTGLQATGTYYCPSNMQYDAATHSCIAAVTERMMAENPNWSFNTFSPHERITAEDSHSTNLYSQQNQQELLRMLANNLQH